MPIDAINNKKIIKPIWTTATKEIQQTGVPDKSNTYKTIYIGVGAVLALTTLGVLGYKGHLGENIQKLLGGVTKNTKGESESEIKNKAKEEIKKTFKELYNDAIKEKKSTLEDPARNRTHNFEYDKNGKLIKETITKGDDYVIYENINGKMRIVEVKQKETVSKRLFDKNGIVELRCKPEVPIKILPTLKCEVQPNLKPEDIPKNLEENILESLKKNKIIIDKNETIGIYNDDKIIKCISKDNKIIKVIEYDKNGKLKTIRKNVYNEAGQAIQRTNYDETGKFIENIICTYDSKGEEILHAHYKDNGKLMWFEGYTKDGKKILFNSKGSILYRYT